FAPWLTALLIHFQPMIKAEQTPLAETIDYRVLAFTLVITTLAGFVFGLIPALAASRPDLIPSLKGEVGASDSRERRASARNALVIAQVSLAFIVLVGAGLFIRSLRHLFAIHPGFETENVLLVPISLDERKYNGTKGRDFQQLLIERFKALPGVISASA